MQFKNKYGYFSQDSREYIITDPRTPRPWFNYIWNDKYASLISHTGGGFSFFETPRDNRLTRMRYNCLPWDRPGKYVIVKDKKTGEYWSLSWAPTIDKEYDSYECRHGQGYTTIKTKRVGIIGEITYFVPEKHNCEIWKVRIENSSTDTKSLEIYSFVELMMGNAMNDIINQPNDKHFTDIHFDKSNKALVCSRRYWVLNKKVSVEQPNLEWAYNLYFGSSLPITGFDGSLDTFIGKWRSEANPLAIENGKMFNTEITAGDPVAALQSKFSLKAGESKEFVIVLGIAEKQDENALENLAWDKLRNVAYAEEMLSAVKQKWDNVLSHAQVQTPDKDFNAMVNVWNPYQAAVTFDMSRNSGYYHGGLLFGTGLRDQFQDILGMVLSNPQKTRARLLNALRFQFKDGSTLHNFYKLLDYGERTNHSDTPLWVPFGIIEYLIETGDFTILDETVTFYDGDSANVYEHVMRAVEFALKAVSKRGLPKIMNGDWNDTLDKVGPKGKGETVWGAFFLGYNLRKCFPLLEKKKDANRLKRWKNAYVKLFTKINEIAWDGEWYIRAFKDDGSPLGTEKAKQGKIFINAQTWAVISGLAPKERADKALNSLKKHLRKPNGVQICYPSYTEVESNVGLISRCVPGKKENGAIFNHASSWAVLASLLNGDIDFGYEVYRSMLPMNSGKHIDRYEVEPYVFAEYVTSPDHHTEGQASHSWLTGTAVWMYRIALDYIFGLRPAFDGIFIQPHIPSHWKKASIQRKFRGKTINLVIENPKKKNISNAMMTVNGEVVTSNFLKTDDFAENVINIKLIM